MGTGSKAPAFAAGTRSQKGRGVKAGTGSRVPALLPTGDEGSQSLTLAGRYQFRRDGVGWECREIVGKGTGRKRPYLAHLSRAHYERMQANTRTRAELETALIEWADRKRAEKWGN